MIQGATTWQQQAARVALLRPACVDRGNTITGLLLHESFFPQGHEQLGTCASESAAADVATRRVHYKSEYRWLLYRSCEHDSLHDKGGLQGRSFVAGLLAKMPFVQSNSALNSCNPVLADVRKD